MGIQKTIRGLIQGVSQQAREVRAPTQVEAQTNALDHPSRGKTKRPPTRHVAQLVSDASTYGSAFLHTIDVGSGTRFRAVVTDAGLKVFDAATGATALLNTPDGLTYLDCVDPRKDIRAITVGSTTYLINRQKTVAKSGAATAQVKEALVWCKQGAFGTTYSISLSTAGLTNMVTVQRTTADDTSQPHFAATQTVAALLMNELLASSTLTAAYDFALYGSTIWIKRKDGTDFAVTVSDGISGEGLAVAKGSVTAESGLPAEAPEGFIVQVINDPTSPYDNYWVKRTANAASEPGIWKECVAPGVYTGFDATTMPHKLIRVADETINCSASLVNGPAPTVAGAGAALTALSLSTVQDGVTVSDDASVVLNASGEAAYANLAGATGVDTTVRAYYDVACEISDPLSLSEADFTVYFERWNGAAWVSVASANYAIGSYANEILSGSATISANQDLRVRLSVTTATNVTISVSVHAKNDTLPGLAYALNDRKVVAFDASTWYPKGSRVTLTVEGTAVQTEATSADYSPAQMCAACAAAITAAAISGITIVDQGTYNFSVKKSTGVPTCTAAVSHANSLSFYSTTLSLTSGGNVGDTLTNLTTGATGTITSNTDKRVSVGSLSGGSRATFVAGDSIRINAGAKFTFSQVTWDSRDAGDDTTCPFPSFVGKQISNVFVTQGRLGVTAGESVVLSRAGDQVNWFRASATQLLADDPIDLKSSVTQAQFHSVVEWQEKVILFSDGDQFALTGEPVLTPTTVRLDRLTQYRTSRDCRPVIAGQRVWLARDQERSVQVLDYAYTNFYAEKPEATDVTKHVPAYLVGTAVQMVADEALGTLAVLTDDNGTRRLYVLNWLDEGGERRQLSWGEWTFGSGTLVAMDILDGDLVLVFKRSDGLYMEVVDLDVDHADTATNAAEDQVARMDRRLAAPTLVWNAGQNRTDVTIPYSLATNGSEGTLVLGRRDTGVLYTVTRVSTTTGYVSGVNLTGVNCFVGVQYRFSCTLSPFYLRDQDGAAITSGRTQVQGITVGLSESMSLSLTGTLTGRSTPVSKSVSSTSPSTLKLRALLGARNTTCSIQLYSDSPAPCRITEVTWDVEHHKGGR